MKKDFDFDSYLNLGSLLVRSGKVTEEQLQRVVEEQRRLGGGHGQNPKIGVVLVELGFCTKEEIQSAVEHQESLRVPSLEKTEAQQDLLDSALDDLIGSASETAEATKTTTLTMRAAHLAEESGPLLIAG